MNADEKAILDYLKGWPHSYVNGKEIARKVGGRGRYEENRGWAIPILAQMVVLGLIEADAYGAFRIVGDDKKKKRHQVHYIAPQLLRILKSSGKSFDGVNIDDEVDDESPAYRKPSKPKPANPAPETPK
jgi:hypothetical protein